MPILIPKPENIASHVRRWMMEKHDYPLEREVQFLRNLRIVCSTRGKALLVRVFSDFFRLPLCAEHVIFVVWKQEGQTALCKKAINIQKRRNQDWDVLPDGFEPTASNLNARGVNGTAIPATVVLELVFFIAGAVALSTLAALPLMQSDFTQ